MSSMLCAPDRPDLLETGILRTVPAACTGGSKSDVRFSQIVRRLPGSG